MPAAKTDGLYDFLATPEAQHLSNQEIAQRFDCIPETVGRARKKLCGPHGGVVTTAALDQVQADFALQLRSDEGGLDHAAVKDYAAAYERGDELPPIVVTPREGGYKLVAGFHRVYAAKQAGKTEIAAEVVELDEFHALCLASKSNVANGKRFTDADRRHAVHRIIAAHPEFLEQKGGGRELQRLTGIDESLFRKIKREILEAREAEASAPPADDPIDDDGPEADPDGNDPEGGEGSILAGTGGPADPPEPDDDAELTEEEKAEILVARQRHPILSTLPTADIRNLQRSPIFLDLHGEQLKTLVEEYLFRKDEGVAAALAALKAAYSRARPKGKLQPIIARQVEILLKARTFDQYVLCGKCGGKGCEACYRRGYA